MSHLLLFVESVLLRKLLYNFYVHIIITYCKWLVSSRFTGEALVILDVFVLLVHVWVAALISSCSLVYLKFTKCQIALIGGVLFYYIQHLRACKICNIKSWQVVCHIYSFRSGYTQLWFDALQFLPARLPLGWRRHSAVIFQDNPGKLVPECLHSEFYCS